MRIVNPTQDEVLDCIRSHADGITTSGITTYFASQQGIEDGSSDWIRVRDVIQDRLAKMHREGIIIGVRGIIPKTYIWTVRPRKGCPQSP